MTVRRWMPEREILTEVLIDAEPSRVWQVLTDFSSYPEWNPMLSSARGELVPGGRLELCFEPEGGRRRTFRPRLLVVEPGRELRWLGSPGVPGLLESQHYFLIDGMGDGRCRLEHGMVFYGLVVPLFGRRLELSTRGPFCGMNCALKDRSESKP